MLYRVNAVLSLALATLLGFLYIPIPESCNDIVYYLIKRAERILINGEPNRDQFCQCFQSDGEESCDLAEEYEQDDDEAESVDENELGGDCERESDGEKND
jgi:hypothetical protein